MKDAPGGQSEGTDGKTTLRDTTSFSLDTKDLSKVAGPIMWNVSEHMKNCFVDFLFKAKLVYLY